MSSVSCTPGSVRPSWPGALSALAFAVGSLFASGASASLVYSVNFGGLTGTITTDGTLGQLREGNFESFSLSFQNRSLTSGSVGCFGQPCILSASNTGLTLDLGDIMLFRDVASGVLQVNAAQDPVRIYWGDTTDVFTTSSPGVFASVRAAPPPGVPEPGALGLVGAGLLAATVARRRQRAG